MYIVLKRGSRASKRGKSRLLTLNIEGVMKDLRKGILRTESIPKIKFAKKLEKPSPLYSFAYLKIGLLLPVETSAVRKRGSSVFD